MRKIYLIYTAVILLFSCSFKDNNEQSSSNKKGDKNLNNGRTNILLRSSKQVNFSDLIKKDTFLLEVKGDSLLKSLIFFKIISYKGEIIYYKQFTSSDIIGNDFTMSDENRPESEMSDSKKEKLIMSKFQSFFNPSNFKKPAISKEIQYFNDTSFPDKYTWSLIKKNDMMNTFYFNIYDETVFFIVFVPEYNEVVEFK